MNVNVPHVDIDILDVNLKDNVSVGIIWMILLDMVWIVDVIVVGIMLGVIKCVFGR